MKKFLCLLLCILFACVGMGSCGSAGVKNGSPDAQIEEFEADENALVGCWIFESGISKRSDDEGTYDDEEVLDADENRYAFQLFSNGEGVIKEFLSPYFETRVFSWYEENDMLIFVYSTDGNDTFSYSILENELILKDVGYDKNYSDDSIEKREHTYVFFKSDVNLYESLDKYYFNAES